MIPKLKRIIDINNTTERKPDVLFQKCNNLLDLSGFKTQTVNGVTFTNNGDGSITVSGTATAEFGLNFMKVKIEAKQYSLTNNVESGTFNLYLYDHDALVNILASGQTKTFTQDYNNVYMDTYIHSGTVFNNVVIKPMLNYGNILPYEPYVEDKILIKNNNQYEDYLEDSVVISSSEPHNNRKELWIQTGKNIFDIETMVELTDAYRRFSDAFITGQSGYNGIKVPVEPNTTYIITTNCPDYSNITFYDKNFNYVSGYFKSDTGIITVPENCYYFCMAVHNEYTWMQIEKGTESTSYEPYTKKSIYIKNHKGVYEEFVNATQINNSINEMSIQLNEHAAVIPLAPRKIVNKLYSGSQTKVAFNVPSLGSTYLLVVDKVDSTYNNGAAFLMIGKCTKLIRLDNDAYGSPTITLSGSTITFDIATDAYFFLTVYQL